MHVDRERTILTILSQKVKGHGHRI